MKLPPLFLDKPVTVSYVGKPLLVLATAGLLSFSPLSLAAGVCKGQAENACSSDDNCSWVKSYTTKKGNTINSYCRNKSKPGKSSVNSGSGAKAKPDK